MIVLFADPYIENTENLWSLQVMNQYHSHEY